MIKAIIFDFDGTIVDTLEDLKDSINSALEKNGFDKKYTYEETKDLIGKGIRVLCTRALSYCDHSLDDEEKVYKSFYDIYSRNQIKNTKPYKGVIDVIKEIKSRGIKVAILSNKKEENLKEIVSYLFPKNMFDYVVGKTQMFPLKPDPASLNNLIDKLDVEKNEVLYIGDSDVDMECAINAKVKKGAVTYGYRSKELLYKYCPEYIINEFKEILLIL